MRYAGLTTWQLRLLRNVHMGVVMDTPLSVAMSKYTLVGWSMVMLEKTVI